MSGKYNLSLEFCTSEEGFSFDELILSLDNWRLAKVNAHLQD